MIRLRTLQGLALACLLAIPIAGNTQGQVASVGGVQVFYGVVPAELLGKEKSAQEAIGADHDRPRGRNVQHLVVALIDPQTGRHIQDATVRATVTPLGLAAEQKELAPMRINGRVTYGNFFRFPLVGAPFRIKIDISRPGGAGHGHAHAEFSYTPPSDAGRSR